MRRGGTGIFNLARRLTNRSKTRSMLKQQQRFRSATNHSTHHSTLPSRQASSAMLDTAGSQRLRSTPSSRPATGLSFFHADVHRRNNPEVEASISLDLKSLPFGALPLLATAKNNMEPRAIFAPGHGDNEPSFLPVAALYHCEIAWHMMRLADPERNRSWLGSVGCARALLTLPRHLHGQVNGVSSAFYFALSGMPC